MNYTIPTLDEVQKFTSIPLTEDEKKKIHDFIEDLLFISDDAVEQKRLCHQMLCINNAALHTNFQETEKLVKEVVAKVREHYNGESNDPLKRLNGIDKYIRPRDPEHPNYMAFQIVFIPFLVENDTTGMYSHDIA